MQGFGLSTFACLSNLFALMPFFYDRGLARSILNAARKAVEGFQRFSRGQLWRLLRVSGFNLTVSWEQDVQKLEGSVGGVLKEGRCHNL